MEGKVVVVTGANAGIGRATCEQLARQGAHVVLVCRNAERGREAVDALKVATGSTRFELVIADLALMSQVRRAAAEIQARHPKIDVLVNNAGVYLPQRHVTAEGFEAMFAINHLAPFLLTHALLPQLAAAAPGRVITVSSDGHRGGHLHLDDLQMSRHFNALRQYCNTKLANILFTKELARRSVDHGLVASAYHPGMVRTGFAQDEPGLFGFLVKVASPFLRSPEKAARTATFLATTEDARGTNGEYFINSRRRNPSRKARDEAVARELWEHSAQLLKIDALPA